MVCACVNAYLGSIINRIKILFIEMSYKYILPGTVLHYKLLHNAETFLIGNTVAFQKNGLTIL